MKFIYICIAILALTGCSASFEDAPDKDRAWTSHGNEAATKVVEIEGHKYIIMDGFRCGCIIHAESCSCKSGKGGGTIEF